MVCSHFLSCWKNPGANSFMSRKSLAQTDWPALEPKRFQSGHGSDRRGAVWLSRRGRKRSLLVILSAGLVCTFLSCLSMAQEAPSTSILWDYDSVAPKTGLDRSPAKEVALALTRDAELWNARDLTGYLACYWNSPKCLLVDESGVEEGFPRIADSYRKTYANPESMGKMKIDRLKIRMIRPDLALAVSVWSITLLNSDRSTVGIATTLLGKFGSDWKIVTSHVSNGSM
jgi:hypothetical protein